MATRTAVRTKLIQGYVRSNFNDNCWVDEIINIIIRYYLVRGGPLYIVGKKGRNEMCKKPTLYPPFKRNTLDFSAGLSHSLILDIHGQVWASGQGNDGQLGIGNKTNIFTPQKLKWTHRAVAVAAGQCHSLILLNNGYVQSFGLAQGQLGHGNSGNVYFPKTIEALTNHKIVQIVAGDSYSACLTQNGDLFCFGHNHMGQCGVGHDKGKFIMVPTKVELNDKIAFISSGANHVLLLTNDCTLYSFGQGWFHRLGHRLHDNKYTPTLVEALQNTKIQSCAAGEFHSICIDKEGIVWAFGSNESGQCGLGKNIEEQSTPKAMQWFVEKNVKAIDCAAGGNQSCVIAEDGSLYVFGNNEKYQLGLKEKKYYFKPRKLSLRQGKCDKKVSMGYQWTAIITN